MTDTRHYLDTLNSAVRAWEYWKDEVQQLIDKYGDDEAAQVFGGERNRLTQLNINMVDDEVCDNPKLWVQRVDEQQATTILMEAHGAITGDVIDVVGDKSKKELDGLRSQIIRCYNEFGGLMMKYDNKHTLINYMKIFDNTLPVLVDSFSCAGKIRNPHELHQLLIDENAIPFDVEFDYFIFCVIHAEYGRMMDASLSKDKVRIFASTMGDKYFDKKYKQASAKSMGCSVSDLTKHKDRSSIKAFVMKLDKLM